MLVLVAPRGLSAWPGPVDELVERPARPAAARHISLTRVLMSVKPRDSRPAARLQLDPLNVWKERREKNELIVLVSVYLSNTIHKYLN